ncbi:MAG: DUF2079 domain-containing protein [Aquabacterium sp.]
MKMSRSFALSALMLLALLYLAVTYAIGKDQICVNRQGDAAIFEQLLANIHARGEAVSNVFANTQNFIERQYFTKPFEDQLKDGLAPPVKAERGMLRFHAYGILFLIAPLLKWWSASMTLALLQVLSSCAVLVIVHAIVRQRTQASWLALPLLTLVVLHPLFGGGLVGQFYPDRLFVPLALILCHQAYRHVGIGYLLITALLTSLVNERAALIGGLLLLLVPFCSPQFGANRKRVVQTLAVGLAMLAYAYAQKRFVLENAYYDTYLPHGIGDLILRFQHRRLFAERAVELLLVSTPLLLLSLGHVRLGAVAVFVMVPNVIGDVGGAEKTGWVTHYHSYYFPVLVFAATMGFVQLLERIKPRLDAIRLPLAAGGVLMLALPIAFALHQLKQQIASGAMPPVSYLTEPWSSYNCYHRGKCPTGRVYQKAVQDAIAADALVSTDELGMALVYDKARVDYFPVAAGQADYLLLPCDWLSGHAPAGARAVPAQWLSDKGFDPGSVVRFAGIERCLLRKR